MTILLTGATGQVGGAALRELSGVPVRVLARDPTALASATSDGGGGDSAARGGAVRGRSAGAGGAAGGGAGAGGGVEVVTGSFDDLASLRAALDGVSVLFLTGRDNPAQVEQHLRVLAIAREAGVRHVVKLSAIGARADSPVALMRWHYAIEEALRGSDLAWTFLRPHLYMQNLLRFAGDVAERARFAAPMGARRYPLVDTRDVGAAVAAVLRDPGAHVARAYALTGPSAVSYGEVAAQLARLVGQPVEYEAVAPEVFRAGLLERRSSRRGGPTISPRSAPRMATSVVSDELPALLGRPATSLERFLDDHRERLRGRRVAKPLVGTKVNYAGEGGGSGEPPVPGCRGSGSRRGSVGPNRSDGIPTVTGVGWKVCPEHAVSRTPWLTVSVCGPDRGFRSGSHWSNWRAGGGDEHLSPHRTHLFVTPHRA